MRRHIGRSMARGTTVTFLRAGAGPGVLGLVLAGLLLAVACGHKTSAAQTLRTCVDRWNQGNMLGWGPTLVSVSIRRLDRHNASEAVQNVTLEQSSSVCSRDHPRRHGEGSQQRLEPEESIEIIAVEPKPEGRREIVDQDARLMFHVKREP